jgi:hypothetical protein
MHDLIKGGIPNLENPIVKDRVFQSIPGFKEWIEQTSLFQNIKRFAGTGIIIEGIPNGLRLQLNGISKVDTANDLPIEMIIEFYNNSPWLGD